VVTKERIKYDSQFRLKIRNIMLRRTNHIHCLDSEKVKTRIVVLQLFSRKTIQHAITKTFAHRIYMCPMKTSFSHVPETEKYRLQLCFVEIQHI